MKPVTDKQKYYRREKRWIIDLTVADCEGQNFPHRFHQRIGKDIDRPQEILPGRRQQPWAEGLHDEKKGKGYSSKADGNFGAAQSYLDEMSETQLGNSFTVRTLIRMIKELTSIRFI